MVAVCLIGDGALENDDQGLQGKSVGRKGGRNIVLITANVSGPLARPPNSMPQEDFVTLPFAVFHTEY